MNEFIPILKAHAADYPKMEPCDAVKLIYQSVFGGGHMIPSPETALERLQSEYASVTHGSSMQVESLGDVSRIDLRCPLSDAELSLVARMFCQSAKRYCKGYADADESARQRFHQRLELLTQLCGEGAFQFTPDRLAAYLADYRAAGYPAVSHSQSYRDAYSPAYRVIDSRYARMIDCIFALGERLNRSDRVVVSIDGRCASGKTTAASLLQELFGGEIVHMDDFFLPPELRTAERLAEVGGNLHRERFIDEVIPHLHGSDGFEYRIFQCSTFTYANKPRRVEPAKLILCEGSYALHPAFGRYYDLAIFSDIAPDEQRRRILARDGSYMLTRFENEWIPMEERYFDAFDIRSKCDFILS